MQTCKEDPDRGSACCPEVRRGHLHCAPEVQARCHALAFSPEDDRHHQEVNQAIKQEEPAWKPNMPAKKKTGKGPAEVLELAVVLGGARPMSAKTAAPMTA